MMFSTIYFKLRNKFLDYNHFKQLSSNVKKIEIFEKKYKNKIYSKNDKIRSTYRSFLQFKLQAESRPQYSLILSEIISLFLLPISILYIILFSRKCKIKKKNICLIKFNSENFNLPPKFKQTRKKIFKERYLDIKSLNLILSIFLKTFSLGYYYNFQFLYKLIKELSLIYPYLNNNNLERIFIFNEYDFTISLSNYLCKQNNVKLINVQHGDIIISAHYSFVEVHSFYIWEKSYGKMLKKMKNSCIIKVFKKERKYIKSFKKKIIGILEPQLMHFNYDKKKFKKYKFELFNQLKNLAKNKKIIFRTHPRYSNFSLDEFKDKNIIIQNGNAEKSEIFLNRCKIIIGTASAMLVDASLMGIKVLVCKNDLVDVLSKYHFFYFKKNVKTINVNKIKYYV